MTWTRLFLIAITGLLMVVMVIRITTENDLVTGGADYARLEDQIVKIRKENNRLKQQIYYYSSYTTLGKEAAAMGFIPMGDPIYILH